MLVAVIDLGTNTFNLLIAEIDTGRNLYAKKVRNRISVKLGEGGINQGYIAEQPFQRGIEAIKRFKAIIDTYPVDEVVAIATSAIRSASNGTDFTGEVLRLTGIKVTVIDGNREAELIYQGTRMAVKFEDAPSLIMDIGGGSTEFIIANKDRIFWKQSFLLGAARLLEKFRPEDPVKKETITAIENYFKEQLAPLYSEQKTYSFKHLIGSSGAFDSFVEMLACETGSTNLSTGETEYTVDLSNYAELSKKIIRSTLEERREIKGLIPMRMDMIVISTLFVDFILKEFNIKKLIVSTYSLKEGVIGEMLGSRTT